MTWKKALIVAVAAAGLGACIVTTETEHTLYLEPSGELTWTVLEKELRSDAADPEERRREEAELLQQLAAHRHPVAVALQGLGAETVTSRLLRRARPYTAFTEARFAEVEDLGWTLAEQLGLPAEVDLETSGDRQRLSVTLWTTEDAADEDLNAEQERLLALFDALESHRLVLTSGRFVEAQGFRLAEDSRVAVLDEPEPVNGRIRLSLTWSTS